MNLFHHLFITALFYNLFLFSTILSVTSKISDKRRCANADCSEPVSHATTLIRYNAVVDRMVSFPSNVKVEVYSKEAGDIPDFWEIKIYGKRGYVPKTFLREQKVLIPPSKLIIVPTGRTETPSQNVTSNIVEEQESKSVNLLSATPELPVANSKGLFSTIGGVSADSVPMNSPDIKPQSTRKFQVFEGTTIFDDVVSEKPESPPTIIDDAVKDGSDKKPPADSDDVINDSNVPLPGKTLDQTVGEKSRNEVDELTKIEDGSKKRESEDSENQVTDTAREPGLLNSMVKKISNIFSSGAGEDITEEGLQEEEDEEGSAEEEDNENKIDESNVEEKSKLEEKSKSTIVKELKEAQHPEQKPIEVTQANTSDAPNFINVHNERSSDLKTDSEQKSENYDDSSEETVQKDLKTDKVEDNEKTTQKSTEISSDNKTFMDMTVKKVDYIPSTSEKEEIVLEPTLLNESGVDLTQDSVLKTEEIISQEETSGNGIDLDAKQDNIQDLKSSEEIKSEDLTSVEVETAKPTEEQSVKVSKSQSLPDLFNLTQPDLSQPQVQTELKTESQDQELPKSEEKNNNYIPQVQEQSKNDNLKILGIPQDSLKIQNQEKKMDDLEMLEQLKTTTGSPLLEPSNQGNLKSDDLISPEQLETAAHSSSVTPQTQDPPKTDDLQAGEQLGSTTESSVLEQQTENNLKATPDLPPAETTTRQFLYSSRQINDISPNQDEYKTSDTPPIAEPHDDIISQDKLLNKTDKVDGLESSESPFSAVPTFQPIGSPKYSSVVSRRIQSSESTVNEVLPNSKEADESEITSHDFESMTESTPIPEETEFHNAPRQSQSPKYSVVVNSRIDYPAPTDNVDNMNSETRPNEVSEVETETTETVDVTTEVKSDDLSTSETETETGTKEIEEVESKEETVVESGEVQDSQLLTPSDNDAPTDVHDETSAKPTSEEGMFSWTNSFFDMFGSKDSSNTGESLPSSEDSDPSQMSHFAEETCSADGIDGSCHTFGDTVQQEVTWQESSYTSDMWDLIEKVPLEATIWLVITAVVVLIFSLGHYYIEAHRRDGPLVAIINKLEREVLILKKESCILDDRLQIAQQQLEAWNTSSTENDALLIELKQELEETKAAKAELEEQTAQLKDELETVTESGLEMHRLLEESLSSQDGSQVLLSTVETLREKLQRQEEEISGLSDTLSSKNAEVDELQGKLAQAAEVARSLEDRVISVSREKDEELLQLRDTHRGLISQLEEVMETKALEETRLSTKMSKLQLTIEELQKTLAEKDSELDTLKEVVKQLRATDSNEKIEALFDVVGVQAKLKTAVSERDDFREKFLEEEGARKLLEGHMKKITQEVADLKNSFETAEKEKIEALTKLQVLSNYFKEKESQLQKELGLQESMWLQKQSDDHSIYEQMRSLREENEKYKLQNESLKKEIVEQEASFKIQLANTEQKAHENWVASRQAERRLKEAQQESAQLRNRLTTVEKNSANYSLDEKPNISESNGDPSSPPPSLMFPPTTSPPFMMYGPPIPPPGDFVPPPPFMSSPYPSDSRPPPLGRISSPPLDPRFSPPPPLPYPPYDYSPYGHHSPSPPPPMPPHHRNVHKPQPRELSRDQKDHVPNYSPEAEKTSRRNKR